MPVFPDSSSPWASAGTERPDQLPPNTCRYTDRTNGLTTREPDERAGNCCQKRWKDLRKGRRCRDATAAKLSLALVTQLLALKWSAFNTRNKSLSFSFEWIYSQQTCLCRCRTVHLSVVLSAGTVTLYARDCMDCVGCEASRAGQERRQWWRSTLRNRNSHKLDKHACLAKESAAW